jgi:1-phosphofructokinase family hexose kinase
MILCICPTPTVERNWVTPNFSIGGFYRVQQETLFASGKSVNVARVVHKLGGSVACAGFVGGHTGQLFLDLIRQEGLPGAWTPHAGETRTSITVLDPLRRQDATSLCHSGPLISPEEWRCFERDVHAQAAAAEHICISGSVPPGVEPEKFLGLVRDLGSAGKRLWLDINGPMLAAALPARPFALKVNGREIAGLLGLPVRSEGEAFEAVRAVHAEFQVPLVIATLGPLGAVGAGIFGDWFVHPISYPQIVSSIGCGDTFLGGLMSHFERGCSFEACLRAASAAAGASTQVLGPGCFELEDYSAALQRTVVEKIDGSWVGPKTPITE